MVLWFAAEHQKVEDPNRFLFDLVYLHNDYGYFLQPVENYFKYGMVTYDGKIAFAARMPGYWGPYLVLRAMMERDTALLVLTLLQIILSGAAVFLLARMAGSIFKSRWSFLAVFIMFTAHPFTAVFDYQTFAESLSVSTFVLHFYFLWRYKEEESRWHLLLSGLFLAWAIFLRPFVGIAFVLVFVLILRSQKDLRRVALHCLIFGLPFILFESAWISRNIVQRGEFIVLNSGLKSYGKIYSPGWQEIRTLLYKMGQETAYVEEGMARWFRGKTDDLKVSFDFLESSEINKMELSDLRRNYLDSRVLEGEEFTLADNEVVSQTKALLEKWNDAHPIGYHLFGPWNGVRKMVFHSGSPYLAFPSFGQMTWAQKALKLAFSLIYYLVLLGSLLSFILMSRANPMKWYTLLYTLLLIFVLITISTIQEARYFITSFPLLLLMSTGIFNFRPLNRQTNHVS